MIRNHVRQVTLAIGLVALGALASAQGAPELTLETVTSSTGAAPGGEIRLALKAHLNPGYHVNSDAPLEDFLIATKFNLDLPEGFTLREIVYPEAILLEQEGADKPLAVFEEEFVIGVVINVAEGTPTGEQNFKGSLRYQACDDQSCYRPMTGEFAVAFTVVSETETLEAQHAELFAAIPFTGEAADPVVVAALEPEPEATPEPVEEGDLLALLADFEILGTDGGRLKPAEFIAFIDRAESGETQKGWFEGRGPIAIIGLILIGGLALNLTPCVLPMIPVNLAIIGAGAQAGSRTRGFLLGGTYGLAMALVYGALGLVVILTAGTFGTINSSPWFNVGIAALFVVLALAMFDVIAIDFSKFQSKLNLGSKGKGTFLLAFAMGSVAALLAGACVAPAVIQVIVFSSSLYAKGTTIALALPFVLGLGMAIPWPFAGAGLSFLPKPGMWMVRVKQVFGVFIFAFAIYYGYLSYGLFSQRWVDSDAVAGSVQELVEEGWYPSLSQGLAVAKAEDKPVLIDMWATWCKNCLTMDKTTFKDEAVIARLDDFIKIKFQAEDPGASPAKEVMKHFDAIGLPTYAVLKPK